LDYIKKIDFFLLINILKIKNRLKKYFNYLIIIKMSLVDELMKKLEKNFDECKLKNCKLFLESINFLIDKNNIQLENKTLETIVEVKYNNIDSEKDVLDSEKDVLDSEKDVLDSEKDVLDSENMEENKMLRQKIIDLQNLLDEKNKQLLALERHITYRENDYMNRIEKLDIELFNLKFNSNNYNI
jgi:hypothetical protein